MTRLLSHSIPKITRTGKEILTEYYQNRHIIPDKPYITEREFAKGLRFTRKDLQNGNKLEVFEDNGTIYKVLLDSENIPFAVNMLKDGKKKTARFFADVAYSHIISKFFDKTGEFLNLK